MSRLSRVASREQFMNLAKQLKKEANLPLPTLQKIKNIFQRVDKNGDRNVSKSEFCAFLKKLEIDNPEIATRIFHIFDRDGNGYIDLREFALSLTVMLDGSFEDKCRFAFQVYDLDGRGEIELSEVEWILASFLRVDADELRSYIDQRQQCRLSSFSYALREQDGEFMVLVKLVMKKFDKDMSSTITFNEFFDVVSRDPMVLEMMGKVLPTMSLDQLHMKLGIAK